MKPIGFDYETYLIGPQRVAPPPVCLSWHEEDEGSNLVAGEDIRPLLRGMLDIAEEDESVVLVAHNAAFDLGVSINYDPESLPRIFSLVEGGRVHCTKIREKLLHLVKWGDLEFITNPDGSKSQISFSLADCVKRRFGEDIKGKEGEDAWRFNFAELEGTPIEEWPQAAKDYAILDSVWTVRVWLDQERERDEYLRETGVDAWATLDFRCAADLSLFLMTAWGYKIDPAAKQEIQDAIEEILTPESMADLIKSGILRPGREAKPYANGAKDHVEGCDRGDGCNCPVKMKKQVKESVNNTKLRVLIEKVCRENGIEIKRTRKSSRFPDGQISTKREWLEEFCHLHPALEQFIERGRYQKLLSTELPRMEWPRGSGVCAEYVHPNYDVLKVTGRTSSFASDAFPSFNTQNLARDLVTPSGKHLKIRNCIVARPGTVLFSIDYVQMELGTLAQRCIDLFGRSTLADKINAGYDLHSFLGAQIAKVTDDGFSDIASDDKDECYEQFMRIYRGESKCPWIDAGKFKDAREWAKHYRTFAKPTGLGYPGGLGPRTFIAYAKATYGIVVDLATAELLRDIWLATFEEMPDYFNAINTRFKDERFGVEIRTDEESGEQYRVQKFAYFTPFGLYRPNADYCAAANGYGLQSPSAEGAILSVIQVVRESYDWTLGSILGPDEHGMTVRPIGFIHDEIVGEIRQDDKTHERVARICELMVDSMRQITPDVTPRVEPALMLRWDKDAKPVYDEEGRLTVWEPAQ